MKTLRRTSLQCTCATPGRVARINVRIDATERRVAGVEGQPTDCPVGCEKAVEIRPALDHGAEVVVVGEAQALRRRRSRRPRSARAERPQLSAASRGVGHSGRSRSPWIALLVSA